MRRRMLLTGAAVLVATKVAVRLWRRSRYVAAAGALSPQETATLRAASRAIVGPLGELALDRGEWDPAAWADQMLTTMTPSVRRQIHLGMALFEEWTMGVRGFCDLSAAEQQRVLAAWRTSRLGIKRAVWSFLHAVGATAFAGSPAGWAAMDYPGPCRPDVGFAGRTPGQSVVFTWDPRVP